LCHDSHVVSDWLQKLSFVVATALAGFLLGPFLGNRWQNHKERIDTRNALVERISNAVGNFAGAMQVEAHRTPSAESRFDTAFVDWQVESETIHTEIVAYVDRASASTASEWGDYSYDMMWVYYVLKRNGAVRPTFALHRVADYLDRPFNTLNGLLDSPFTRARTVNKTHESALTELVLQLRLKERAIILDILN
jgi:hypothetical protein